MRGVTADILCGEKPRPLVANNLVTTTSFVLLKTCASMYAYSPIQHMYAHTTFCVYAYLLLILRLPMAHT